MYVWVCVSHIYARDGNKGKIVGHHIIYNVAMYVYGSAVFIARGSLCAIKQVIHVTYCLDYVSVCR